MLAIEWFSGYTWEEIGGALAVKVGCREKCLWGKILQLAQTWDGRRRLHARLDCNHADVKP